MSSQYTTLSFLNTETDFGVYEYTNISDYLINNFLFHFDSTIYDKLLNNENQYSKSIKSSQYNEFQ